MNYKKIENKRTWAIIIALGVLLVSVMGNLFLDTIKISRLEEKIDKDHWLQQLVRDEFEENIIQGSNPEQRIAVVNVDGVIGADVSSPLENILGGAADGSGLDDIIEDPTIKGVILNVNSPGGGVYESARMWRKIKEIQDVAKIPVYTQMGEVAASGGYYIAAPSEKIFAAEETITGSIGVISDYINIRELEEKIGIKHEVIKSGKHKDIGSANREMTDDEREINQEQIDEFFDKFVAVIAEGRDMSEEEVLNLADGRVYTGKQAYENGLIDEIGYFEDVVESMVADLKLDDPQVIEKKAAISTFGQFLNKINLKVPNNETSFEENDWIIENHMIDYIRKNQEKGNLPEFYYMYGGM